MGTRKNVQDKDKTSTGAPPSRPLTTLTWPNHWSISRIILSTILRYWLPNSFICTYIHTWGRRHNMAVLFVNISNIRPKKSHEQCCQRLSSTALLILAQRPNEKDILFHSFEKSMQRAWIFVDRDRCFVLFTFSTCTFKVGKPSFYWAVWRLLFF